MEKPDLNPSYLFFHMGPGFHSQVEAAVFQNKYPHVAFLDQPLDVNYTDLKKWAEDTVTKYSAKASEPLTLLGHSFGGRIILDILSQVKEQVGEIRLLNSAFDPFDCFLNLYTSLGLGELDSEKFKSKELSEKMQLIFQVAQAPGFNEAYWGDAQKHREYLELAAPFSPLNLETFVKVFSQFLSEDVSTDFTWEGRAQIIYSLEDKLISRDKVMDPWHQVFTRANFIKLPNLGHYAHFESSQASDVFFRKN